MDLYLQIGLGAIPVMLFFLALLIFSKKNRIRNIIFFAILSGVIITLTIPPTLRTFRDARGNVRNIDELNLVYAIAAEGSPELAKSLLVDLQVEYKPEYALASARLAVVAGDYRVANVLYMKSRQYFTGIEDEYLGIRSIFEAEKEYDVAATNQNDSQIETALTKCNTVEEELSSGIILIIKDAIRNDDNVPYAVAARYIIDADNVHKEYLLGEFDYTEDAKETRKQLRQIDTFMQENPGFSAIPKMRLARLKLQILCEEYKSIAANVNEHSDHNELLIVSELLLNNYVKQSDFSGKFSLDNASKYEIVFNKLNDVYNSYYQDKSRDERNIAKEQLRALRIVIRNPALGRIGEELSNYTRNEYSIDASKVFMQKAKIEHSFGNKAKVVEYIDRSFDTVGDCEDFEYVLPMYEIISIITDNDDAGRVKQAADFVEQVLKNNMTIKMSNISETRIDKEVESNADDSLRGEFSLQMQTYISQKRMAVNIVSVDTSQFSNNNTIKATVNISNNLYTSSDTLENALSIRDCGVDITDFTVEKVNYTKANILLCLDVSGSMAGNNKIGMLREAVRYFSQDMENTENIAIVEFDSSIVRQYPFGLSSNEIASIADSISYRGGTNMYDALIGSILQFSNNPGEINSIILMSDGMDNNSRGFEDIIQNISNPAKEKRIIIYSIGFGDDADHGYLNQFSSTTGGDYLFAAEPDVTTQLNQLEDFFDGLRAQILNQYTITFKAIDNISQSRELVVSVDNELNRDRVIYHLEGGVDYSIIDLDEEVDSPIFLGGKVIHGFEPRQLFKNGNTMDILLKGEGFASSDNISIAIKGNQFGLNINLNSSFVDTNSVSVSIPAGVGEDVYDAVVTINGKTSVINEGLIISMQGNVGNKISTEFLASLANIAYDSDFYGRENQPIIIRGSMDYRGWKIVHSHQEDNDTHGLWYLVLGKGDDIIIAFRGTPPPGQNNSFNAPDWMDTIGSIIVGRHRQSEGVESEIQNEGGIDKYLTGKKTIYITGHSLGGYLSMESFRQIAISRRAGWINKIETFNPVGMGSDVSTFINSQTRAVTHHQTCCDIAKVMSNIRGLKFPGNTRYHSAGCDPCIIPRRDASWWENVWSAYNLIGLVDISNPANMVDSWVGLAIKMGKAHGLEHFDIYDVNLSK